MEQLNQIGLVPVTSLIMNNEIINYLVSEGRVLLKAPVIFIVVVAATWWVAWWLRGQWASEKLDALRAQVALKEQSLQHQKELTEELKWRSEQRKPRRQGPRF